MKMKNKRYIKIRDEICKTTLNELKEKIEAELLGDKLHNLMLQVTKICYAMMTQFIRVKDIGEIPMRICLKIFLLELKKCEKSSPMRDKEYIKISDKICDKTISDLSEKIVKTRSFPTLQLLLFIECPLKILTEILEIEFFNSNGGDIEVPIHIFGIYMRLKEYLEEEEK